MGPLILDANVLIGLLDTADGHHEKAVRHVDAADQARRDMLVPASAYGEALVAFARAGRVGDARSAIAGMGIAVVPLTSGAAEIAAELRARHRSLRFPDALILATALEHGGDLLTFDDGLGKIASASL